MPLDPLFLLLFWVLALGILWYMVKDLPAVQPFRGVVVGILALIILILIWRAFGLPTGLPR